MAGATTAPMYIPVQTQILVDYYPTTAAAMSMQYQVSDDATVDPAVVSNSDVFSQAKKFHIANNQGIPVEKGSITIKYNGDYCVIDENNQVIGAYDPETALGTVLGTIDWDNGIITITDSEEGDVELEVLGGATYPNVERIGTMFGRTPGSPIIPGQFTVSALPHGGGDPYTASGDSQGVVTGDNVRGAVDYNSGSFYISFGEWVTDDAWAQSQLWYNEDDDDGAGNVWQPFFVSPEDATINCVVTSYLPLDADLLGLNPVRLPSDGKVPIFKDGDIIMVHNSKQYTCPNPLSADDVITLPRANVSLIELYDSDGLYVPETGIYSVDLAAGEITMENPLDLSAYNEPLVALHRVEDLCLASDVQVTGHMVLTSGLQHDYLANETLVSSVLPAGDLQSRVYNAFFQDAWTGDWSNTAEGGDTIGKYDLVNYPIVTTNKNAVQERFAVIFQSSSSIQLVGEHLGVIYSGGIVGDIAPANPATGNPYFTIASGGWGSGWVAGDVFRFNLAGGGYPYWFCRTTLQGPATENSDKYVVQLRGDSA